MIKYALPWSYHNGSKNIYRFSQRKMLVASVMFSTPNNNWSWVAYEINGIPKASGKAASKAEAIEACDKRLIELEWTLLDKKLMAML
jgi:hypothetical protein